jgi:hypothetical protein
VNIGEGTRTDLSVNTAGDLIPVPGSRQIGTGPLNHKLLMFLRVRTIFPCLEQTNEKRVNIVFPCLEQTNEKRVNIVFKALEIICPAGQL